MKSPGARFGTILLCFVQLTAVLSLTIVHPGTASHRLQRRVDTPGIGIEMEAQSIQFKNDNADACVADDGDKTKTPKGRVINGEDHDTWKLTAEDSNTGPGSTLLQTEIIVKGETVKLGSGQLSSAVNDIFNFMGSWAPKVGGPGVSIDMFTKCGNWPIIKPSTFSMAGVIFGYQVTAALPLEAIQYLFTSLKKSPTQTNPILTTNSLKISRMHLVERSHFQGMFDELPGNLLTDDLLGFFSLIVSYAKYADQVSATDSPKMITSIMPRTDFGSIYKIIMGRLSNQYGSKCFSPQVTLFSIVRVLAMFKGDGTDGVDDAWAFQGVTAGRQTNYPQLLKDDPNDKLRKMSFNWEDENGNKQSLSVEDWLTWLEQNQSDKLVGSDAKVDGQIGALGKLIGGPVLIDKLSSPSVGSKMEGLINNPGRLVPIFEYRDLLGTDGNSMKDTVLGFEKAVMALQDKFNNPPPSLIGRRDGSSCALSLASPKCPQGQAAVGTNGQCGDCPQGEEPNADGTECKKKEDPEADPYQKGKCKDGRVLDPAEGGQNGNTPDPVCTDDPSKACPAGQVPASPARDNPQPGKPQCGKDADEKNKPKCPETQYSFVTIDEKGNAQYSCKNTRKTDGKGKGQDPPKSTDPDDEKKQARNRFCLAFMAGSGLIGGAEELGTDEGKGALLNSSAIWPDGVTYKDGMLTDSNVDIDHVDSTAPPPTPEVVDSGMEIAKRNQVRGLDDSWKIATLDGHGILHKRQFAAVLDVLESAAKGGAGDVESAAAKTATEDATRAASRGGKGEAAQPDAAKVADLAKLTSAQRLQKATDSIKKIRDDPMYANCLGMIAGAVADAELHIDGVPEGGFTAQANLLMVIMDSNIDAKEQDHLGHVVSKDSTVIYATHNDAFWHNNRLTEFQCRNASIDIGKVSAYNVTGGCCQFYRDNTCGQPLFMATNREDRDLAKNGGGLDNDLVNSVACTYDLGCKGVPGGPGGPNTNEYARGQCGVHVVQYQRKDKTDSIHFDVTIKDSNQATIGSVLNQPAADDLVVPSKLADPGFKLHVYGDQNVTFEASGKSFVSDPAGACKFGGYDGDGGHPGKRQGDCGFAC